MSLFDKLVGQLGNHADVANLAGKLGIDPALAEKAIAALGHAHQQPGDTVELASAKTGIDAGILGQMVQEIGGEGSLLEYGNLLKEHPQLSGVLGMLDRDGDGNPLDDIADMAKGLFGKN